MECTECHKDLQIGDWPWCPHEKPQYGVIGDECDIWVRHGICNEDGTPRHYTSREEMRKEAKRLGVINIVRHVPAEGSDKSKHTSRWV